MRTNQSFSLSQALRHPAMWLVVAVAVVCVGRLNGASWWAVGGCVLALPLVAFVGLCYYSTLSIMYDWFKHFAHYKPLTHLIFAGIFGASGYCWWAFYTSQSSPTLVYLIGSFVVISVLMSVVLMFISVGISGESPYKTDPVDGLFANDNQAYLEKVGMLGALSQRGQDDVSGSVSVAQTTRDYQPASKAVLLAQMSEKPTEMASE